MGGQSAEFDTLPRRHEDDRPLRVRRLQYRRFGLWIDDQLEQLVARWKHTAAPAASRPSAGRLAGVAEIHGEP